MNLGPENSAEGEEHHQQVYEAILFGKRVRSEEIRQFIDYQVSEQNKQIEEFIRRKYQSGDYSEGYIEQEIKKNLKNSIKIRTIQRCIEKDRRIIKKRWYYEIDEKARFETRYQDPVKFGSEIFGDVIENKGFQSNEFYMSELIKRIGAVIMFIFIEASRPFEDKTRSISDRDELIEYWAKKAVPLDLMFTWFWIVFNSSSRKKFLKKTLTNIETADWYIAKPFNTRMLRSKPRNEMYQLQIDECLKMLEKSYPEVYKELAKHKKSAS